MASIATLPESYFLVVIPPTPILSSYKPIASSTPDNDRKDANRNIPYAFQDAMTVREEVFVHEQNVPAENEVDEEEGRCWHWVVYVNENMDHNAKKRQNQEWEEEDCNRIEKIEMKRNVKPVATVRLVPPPHTEHYNSVEPSTLSAPGTTSSRASKSSGDDALTGNASKKESYVKLGRLAVLSSHRRKGLAAYLVRTCLGWATTHQDEIDRFAGHAAVCGHEERCDQKKQHWQGLVRIHAQADVIRWYERQGFKLDRDEEGEVRPGWDEEGIWHLGMWTRVQSMTNNDIYKDITMPVDGR